MEDISYVATTLRHEDNSVVVVPNQVFSKVGLGFPTPLGRRGRWLAPTPSLVSLSHALHTSRNTS